MTGKPCGGGGVDSKIRLVVLVVDGVECISLSFGGMVGNCSGRGVFELGSGGGGVERLFVWSTEERRFR
jgi:hypothetical protein